MSTAQFPTKESLLPAVLPGTHLKPYGFYYTPGGTSGPYWKRDAFTWLDMNQSTITDTVRPSWVKSGTAFWGTSGSIQTSWITYKRLYISLDNIGESYGTQWAINSLFKNTAIQSAYNFSGRPALMRGNAVVTTTDGDFFVSHQSTASGGTPTQTELRLIQSGAIQNVFLDWGETASATAWHRVTLTSDGTNIKLFVNGTLRDTVAGMFNIPSSAKQTYLGINFADNSSSTFDVAGHLHFSWLNYCPSEDEVVNTIHPELALEGLY